MGLKTNARRLEIDSEMGELMKNVVILVLVALLGYVSILLVNERLNPQIVKVRAEMAKLEKVHTATVEECGEVWVRLPTTQKLLDKINNQ
jgi:hypothetical protein